MMMSGDKNCDDEEVKEEDIAVTDSAVKNNVIDECMEVTADGPFSRVFKNNYTSRIVSKNIDKKENIEYTYTKFEPNGKAFIQNVNHLEKISADDVYNMDAFPRGIVTLLNVRDFHKELLLKSRQGTDRDAEDLCRLFLDLGFIVDRHDNPSVNKIHQIAENVTKGKHTEQSCCIFIVLSHGERDGTVYGTDDAIKISDITEKFHGEKFAGKPKFFIFQACRGYRVMDSVSVLERDGPPSKKSQRNLLTLPTEADFLYAYSTVPEYFSYRSPSGSWFIQALCTVFREKAHEMEVYRMLTRVNEKVAQREANTGDPKSQGSRQIASIVSQLRKDFYLYPAYRLDKN